MTEGGLYEHHKGSGVRAPLCHLSAQPERVADLAKQWPGLTRPEEP